MDLNKETPAFPRPFQGHDGMSLRDYFAGQALIGILSNLPDQTSKSYAIRAYDVADAMIERKKQTATHEEVITSDDIIRGR
jgi:hypothetical protein